MGEYKAVSDKLVELLSLETPPVGVKFSTVPPDGVGPIEGEFKACMGLDLARFEKKVFYAAAPNLGDCQNGMHYLGLAPPFGKLKTGEWLSGVYPDQGRRIFKTTGAARRAQAQYAIIETGTVEFISYAPLDLAPFQPDVVVLFVNPKQAMYLSRASVFETGGASVGITGPASCSTIMAAPYLYGEARYSLGCFGGRIFVKIRTEELYFGLPMEQFAQTVANLDDLLQGRPDLAAILREPVGTYHEADEYELKVQKPPEAR